MALGNYSAAYDDANATLSLDSLMREAWLLRGQLRDKLYYGVGALADFTRSLECPGPKDQAYRYRAMSKIKSKDLAGAEQDYLAAINDDFMNEELRVELGNLYLQMQDQNKAYEMFHNVNSSMEPTPGSWCGEGQSLLLINKNKDALVCFGNALKLDDAYRAAYVGLGRTQANLKKYDDALTSLTTAIRLDDLKSDAYYERGCVYVSLKDKEKACSDFSKAEILGSTLASEKKAANCQ
jgi:tetratricopeptide (TPR) repeat protein